MKVGDYVRTEEGYICKILKLNESFEDDGYLDHNDIGSSSIQEKNVTKSSEDLVDLVEYKDLLEIENRVKLYDGKEMYFFNPVRCDGFTTYGDGTTCMIINLDYLVNIKELKIKSILTYEQFNKRKYEVK